MKIKLAKTIGFCMGVRRVIELTLSYTNYNFQNLYTYGPLIHNSQVLEKLKNKGVKIINQIPPPSTIHNGIIIIRAHGIPPKDKSRLKEAGFTKIIDGTCPRVVKVQKIITQAINQNYNIIIVGDPNHPEVVGLLGYSLGKGLIITKLEEINNLHNNILTKTIVVAQTTQRIELYNKICQKLQKHFSYLQIYKTICEATQERQNEILPLINKVDGIIIIGDHSSANTNQLAKIASSKKKPTFLIESPHDLNYKKITTLKSIGITSGTSTPNWIIKDLLYQLITVKSQHESYFIYWIKQLFLIIIHSYLLTVLGIIGITVTNISLQGIRPTLFLIEIIFLYSYSIYTINQFLIIKNHYINTLKKQKIKQSIQLLLSLFLICLNLIVCNSLKNWLPLIFILMITLLKIFKILFIKIYKINQSTIYKIKNNLNLIFIKNILIWTLNINLLSIIFYKGDIKYFNILALIYILIMIFNRSLLSNTINIQKSLLKNKKHIFFKLEINKYISIINYSLITIFITLTLFKNTCSLYMILSIPIINLIFIQKMLSKSLLVIPKIYRNCLTDLNFLFAGILSFLWWIVF